RLLLEVLASRGVRGTVARDLKTAEERFGACPWDLVVTDLDVPGGGFEVVRRVRAREPELPIVMLSREAPVETTVRAMRAGCDDFLVKPLDRAVVEGLLDRLVPRHVIPTAEAAVSDGRGLFRIVGRSEGLGRAISLARKVAATSVPVLVTGESGTGKELIAWLIHQGSRRAAGPYLRVNCAAVSESLLESELFGHERGAFTGAVAQRKGRFELAHGGTLLLDEVTETGPRLQAELLRVLEHQDFERVGGSQAVRVNVRIVSTTNRDLARMAAAGEFRQDLFYRLAGVRVQVPALRERREDIPLLVWHFVNQFARETQRAVEQLDPAMMELFCRSDWPGNVRQLRNVVRTALIVGSSKVLSLADCPWLEAELARAPGPARPRSLRLRDVERRTILEALRLTDRHQVRAAALLGITDRTLREKLRRYREQREPEEVGESQWLRAPA
ncbi:MAG: sigma-54-dependent Fis family transcriptional regulator, partial [Planctomycetes bacterium]|nr:sigma-54-dependent Fis family transcriptional regulator [Planctomycetota bacterium]